MRILVVEDNNRLSELIASGLRQRDFEVDVAGSISRSLTVLTKTRYSAIILDLGLPDGDGLAMLQFLRDRADSTPVLILTARQTVADRVEALKRGADDYLGKPFAFDELVARILTLLRRQKEFVGDQLSLGRLNFETRNRQAFIADKHQPLPLREAAVLEALMSYSNKVVPKRVIEDRLYGLSEDGSPNAVEVYVSRLRRRLIEAGANIEIHTIRGVGYLIKETST